MPYPRLRPLANRIRGVRAPLLYRQGLKKQSVETKVNDAAALIIAPHHDDETLGCGGLIALKRAAGVPVQIVILTDGSRSHLEQASLPIADIIASRRREVTAACEVLGVTAADLHFLNGADGELAEMASVERSEFVHRLAEIVTRSGAGEIYVTYHKDCHPDHEAAHALIADAMDLAESDADLLEYPIWVLWKRTLLDWSSGEFFGAERVDVSSVQEKKDKAIEVYGSQLGGMPKGFVPQFQQGEEFFWRRPSVNDHAAKEVPRGAMSGIR